jgi:hypothetical protein
MMDISIISIFNHDDRLEAIQHIEFGRIRIYDTIMLQQNNSSDISRNEKEQC